MPKRRESLKTDVKRQTEDLNLKIEASKNQPSSAHGLIPAPACRCLRKDETKTIDRSDPISIEARPTPEPRKQQRTS